jgi:hypothetical protein
MFRFYYIFIAFIILSVQIKAGELSGYIEGEVRYFSESPLSVDQYDGFNLSLSAKPEYHHQWDDGKQTFDFIGFARVDQHDSKRSHFDIRELSWIKAAETWELRAGIRKVFWGVTESQHLVDVINQTDLVEHLDGEEKLGQPMINLALIRDWGTLDFFILPYFRERTFPGSQGRLLNAGIPIDVDQARYESSAEEHHVDWAIRFEKTIEDWEIGISHFVGTNRSPRLLMEKGVFIPFYEQIQQTGLELQLTQESMLWKLELISRQEPAGRYTALTGGFEYSFVGIFDSNADLGIITEYLFDDRQDYAMTPFANDLMLGMRLALNDEQSTELLAGTIVDLDNNSSFYLLEASRRLGDNWKLSLESYIYSNIEVNDLTYGFRNEDFVQFTLAWYF